MNKNLIISSVGDNSLHEKWITNEKNYDIFLIYYGNNDEIYEKYKNNCDYIVRNSGEKGKIYFNFVKNNLEKIKNYEVIWQPDDDIDIDVTSINNLFKIHKKYDLWLSQPSIDGFVSHSILKKENDSILRYTNFVEVLCPMFSTETFLKLYETWDYNYSSWGLDFLWPKLLGYPMNKIAIIDKITAIHTRPPGHNNSRYPKDPMIELQEIVHKYGLILNQVTYSKVYNNDFY